MALDALFGYFFGENGEVLEILVGREHFFRFGAGGFDHFEVFYHISK